MKHALRNLAAVVCLLVILIGSGTCMVMAPQSKKAVACSDCTKHMPQQQKQQPCWCSVHQQPPMAAAVNMLEQPALAAYEVPVPRFDIVGILSPANGMAGPPSLPPPITLRI